MEKTLEEVLIEVPEGAVIVAAHADGVLAVASTSPLLEGPAVACVWPDDDDEDEEEEGGPAPS